MNDTTFYGCSCCEGVYNGSSVNWIDGEPYCPECKIPLDCEPDSNEDFYDTLEEKYL